MKVLFCDLDGTIRETISGEKFINKPDDQKLIKGVKENIARYAKHGWLIVGITNQKGVILGFKSLEDCVQEQKITMQLLPELSVTYACPDDGESMLVIARDKWSIFEGKFKDTRTQEDKNLIPAPPEFNFDSFRKPGIGMLQYFIHTHHPISQALFIGDMKSDRQCAEKLGIEFIWGEELRKQYLIA